MNELRKSEGKTYKHPAVCLAKSKARERFMHETSLSFIPILIL